MLIVLESILWVIRFFFGACIFSFLNVVIDRLPRGESVVNGRSHCTNCGRVLHAWELRFLRGSDWRRSIYRLRDSLWLWQFWIVINAWYSHVDLFWNTTCGSPY